MDEPGGVPADQAEHDHYVAESVTIVESKIASLLAVCAAHGVAGGAVVVVSANPDIDDDPVDWNTMFNTQRQALSAVIGLAQAETDGPANPITTVQTGATRTNGPTRIIKRPPLHLGPN